MGRSAWHCLFNPRGAHPSPLLVARHGRAHRRAQCARRALDDGPQRLFGAEPRRVCRAAHGQRAAHARAHCCAAPASRRLSGIAARFGVSSAAAKLVGLRPLPVPPRFGELGDGWRRDARQGSEHLRQLLLLCRHRRRGGRRLCRDGLAARSHAGGGKRLDWPLGGADHRVLGAARQQRLRRRAHERRHHLRRRRRRLLHRGVLSVH